MDAEEFELYRQDLNFDETALPGIVEDANRLLELQERETQLEHELGATRELIAKLRRELLPEKMAAAKLKSITLPSGWSVDVKFKVMGSLVKGDRDPMRRVEALDTLRKLGGDEIIKNTMTIIVDKGFDNLVHEIMSELNERWGLNPELKEDVNAMTLQAWTRRQLEEVEDKGNFIAQAEKMGLYIGNEAKVTKET